MITPPFIDGFVWAGNYVTNFFTASGRGRVREKDIEGRSYALVLPTLDM
jgi:hypothetical protein